MSRNLDGSHPFYLDTRYHESDGNGNPSLVTIIETSSTYVRVSPFALFDLRVLGL